MNAPKPGCGVRALFRFYRQLRPMPAHEALHLARYHEGMAKDLGLWS